MSAGAGRRRSRSAASSPRLPLAAVLGAVLRRPDLWWTGLRQASTLASPGWWRRAPFLPLPAPDYLRFRLVTAYGGDGDPVRADGGVDASQVGRDLVAYLEWCRTRPTG